MQDGSSEWGGFAERDRLQAGPLEAEGETTDATEQVKD